RLVDPDNRGLIDFERRITMLSGLGDGCPRGCSAHVERMLENWRDARVKLHVMSRALHARRENAALYSDGEYMALETSGRQSGSVIAFARRHENSWAICVVPRRLASQNAPLIGAQRRKFWEGTALRLPEGALPQWKNVLAGSDEPAIANDGGYLPLSGVFAG